MEVEKKLQIVYVPIDEINPNPANPRRPTDEDIAAVKQSIITFGYDTPILVRREGNMVIAGHTRLKALKELGHTEVPVVFTDLDEISARVRGVNDNKLVENVRWDFPMLADLFVDFDQNDVKFDLTGFDQQKIENIVTFFGNKTGTTDSQQDGMPAFEQENQNCYKSLIVHFLKVEDYVKFTDLVGQKLTDKTKFIWYPKQDSDQFNTGKEYVDES